MEKTGANLKPSNIRLTLLSGGGLLFGVWLCFAYRYPLFLTESVGATASSLIMFFAAVIGAALLPIAYWTINRIRSRIWGRYHLSLAVLTLLASLCCALLWSGFEYSYAARVVNACINLPLLVVFSASMAYIAYSINTRLFGREVKSSFFRGVAVFVGIALGVLLIFLPETGLGIESVGYGAACLILLGGLLVYFAGVGGLPRFVRPASKKVTLKAVGVDFLKRNSPRKIFAAVSYAAAVASAVIVVGFLPTIAAQMKGYGQTVAAACGAVGFAAYAIAGRKASFSGAVVFGGSFMLVGTAVFTVWLRLTPLGGGLDVWIAAIGFVLFALGAGTGVAALKKEFEKSSADGFFGANYCLEIMLLALSSGTGAAVAAIASALKGAAAVLTSGIVCAALTAVAVAFALSSRRVRDVPGKERRQE